MSDNMWQRLAKRTPKATGLICWADVREWLDNMAAAEDAEREGQKEWKWDELPSPPGRPTTPPAMRAAIPV